MAKTAAALPKSALATKQVTLKFTKETPNTIRFDAESDTDPIQNIYVKKSAFPTGIKPRFLSVDFTGQM